MKRRKNDPWLAGKKAREVFRHAIERMKTGSSTKPDFGSLPPRPLVPEYFRTCPTVQDAVRRWKVQTPFREYAETQEDGASNRRLEERRLRAEAADRILKALGSSPYPSPAAWESADDAVFEWTRDVVQERNLDFEEVLRLGNDHPDPAGRTAFELAICVRELLHVFRSPADFFAARAALVDPSFLGLPREGPSTSVARTLRVWGPGALLNPKLYRKIRRLSPADLALVLALADERKAYREGREKGRKDSKPRPRRVDSAKEKRVVYRVADAFEEKTGESRGAVARAIKLKAARDNVKPETIKRRMTPRKTKK